MKNKNGVRRIATDIDGVLFNFLKPFILFYNQRHGTNFTIENITSYDFPKVFQLPGEEFRRDMNEFYLSPLFKNLPLIPGAQRGVRKISQNNFLGVVTSRPDLISRETLLSLQEHFPHLFSEVHFTSQYGGNGHKEKKSEYCLEHGYEMIIEDVAGYANECAERGIAAFLLTRPWNREEILHPNVIRVIDWPEIEERLQ
jgi:uncharacterized HAD superfamily protein